MCSGLTLPVVLPVMVGNQAGFGDNQRRSALALTQIGEWKRKDNHVAFYKSRHASSSSGRSQSLESTRSLAIAVGEGQIAEL